MKLIVHFFLQNVVFLQAIFPVYANSFFVRAERTLTVVHATGQTGREGIVFSTELLNTDSVACADTE